MSQESATKIKQPQWFAPRSSSTDAPAKVLKLYNTLTRNKDEFLPKSGNKQVTWYSCGPTVYDTSHMGHARNYVTIDINRRIIEDYFGYDVSFVQNVTDIDDKIILRARQTYLFDKYVNENAKKVDLIFIETSLKPELIAFINKNLKLNLVTIEDFNSWEKNIKIEELKIENPKIPMHITSIKNCLQGFEKVAQIEPTEFYSLIKDILISYLDAKFGQDVNEPEIFIDLPRYWENEFNKDMDRLNVRSASITTRVSEYVPEIVAYVEQIVANGYAYPTKDGSVYFDTAKFDCSDNHDYAKNQPWNKGKLDLIEDGEGSLTAGATLDDKKSPNDFALWKSSKPGEPKWESTWGQGRPGWHIECSVMASDIHGSNMDIHSGGIDLAFPHHDNELAQAEAHYDCDQWVNYFLHTGHLHIEGQKMSKSLKNFISIDEALNKYSARQLRLCFGLVSWNSQLDFKEALITEAKNLENVFNNFFKNVRALNNDYKHSIENGKFISKKTTVLEKQLNEDLKTAQNNIHAQFCDNLNVPAALKSLSELVSKSNTYIQTTGSDIKIEYVINNCKYISKILNIVGFAEREDKLGWLDESSTGDLSSSSNGSLEDTVLPYVKVLCNFRDDVREFAIKKEPYNSFLSLSDKVRDEDLLSLNISLDDRAGQASLIKFLTDAEKEEMISFIKEKEQRQKEKELKKIQQLQLKEQQEKEKKEKAAIKPEEMFLKQTDIYSEFDLETGLPTKDKEGNEVTKSMLKKLKKMQDAQRKLHLQYFSTE
ncbi:hypothetical protein QEN19_002894 [Hanseniaspora menglaensis]